MKRTSSLAALVATLPELEMDELWAHWDRYFDQRPRHRNRDFLIARVGYEMQAEAYGRVPEKVRQQLERLGGARGAEASRPADMLMPGTVLTREHGGKTHRVAVRADGAFDYDGERYTSLSAVARRITGTRWNGRRFFGLKKVGA